MPVDLPDWQSVVGMPQLLIGSLNSPSDGTTAVQSFTVPKSVQGLVFTLASDPTKASFAQISDNIIYHQRFYFGSFLGGRENVLAVVPFLSILTGQITVEVAAQSGFVAIVNVYALTSDVAAWAALFPLPSVAPSESPLVAGSTSLANNTAAWLIQSAPNVVINIFEVTTVFISGPAAALYRVGHSATLPTISPAISSELFHSGNTGAFAYEFHGAPLPAGDGIWVWNESGSALNNFHLLTFSKH